MFEGRSKWQGWPEQAKVGGFSWRTSQYEDTRGNYTYVNITTFSSVEMKIYPITNKHESAITITTQRTIHALLFIAYPPTTPHCLQTTTAMTPPKRRKRAFFLTRIATILASIGANDVESCTGKDGASCASKAEPSSLGSYPYATWEDAPASYEEFDHDNDERVCRLPIISVEEWEEGRYWEGDEPVLVQNVTEGWAALEHWKKLVIRFAQCTFLVHDLFLDSHT